MVTIGTWYLGGLIFRMVINKQARRLHRRLMHQTFHPAAAKRFQPHEIKATHGLLRRMLDDPDNLIGNLRQ
jgi:cytochrome P450